MSQIADDYFCEECFSFIYGDEAIAYRVIRKDKTKAEKITIKVQPTSEVQVIADFDANANEIQTAVLKCARWIWESVNIFKQAKQHAQPKQYISGDMMFYLGRRYVLKVIENPSSGNSIKLTRGQLQVCLKQFDENKQSKVKAMVKQWYRQRAEIVFKERINAVLPNTPWVKEQPPFKILAMQKQWGSCSIKGNIMLNPHLIKAPKECIDYVIAHELCHIAEHNHSERFWRLLSETNPNWKDVKLKLDGMAELYLGLEKNA